MVQLREKDLSANRLLALACELRAITSGKALLMVNDRIDVAISSGADGVQLGEDSLDVASARQLMGKDMLIGRSVHSTEGARQAQEAGADFVVLGTMFETESHPVGPTGGLELARNAAMSLDIPILGIGGIAVSNIADVLDAGLSGAAVITAISMAEDAGAATEQLATAMRGAYSNRRARK